MTELHILDAEIRGDGFKFSIGYKEYTFPHLNQVKREIRNTFLSMEADIKRYIWLVSQVTDEVSAKEILSQISIEDIESLIEEWVKHSGGRSLGKFLEVGLIVKDYTGALEADLRKNYKIKGVNEFLDLPIRVQIQLCNELKLDQGSSLVRALNGWKYNWSLLDELMATLNDTLIQVNMSKKDKNKFKPTTRPFPVKNGNGQKKIAEPKPSNGLNKYELMQKYRANREGS